MLNKLKIPKYRKAKVNLFDFAKGMNGEIDGKIASSDIAELSVNFANASGALCDGVGIKQLEIPQISGFSTPTLPIGVIPLKSYYYKRYDSLNENVDDRILVYADDGFIYENILSSSVSVMSKISELSFSEKPNAVCYKLNGDDVIIFSNSQEMKIYDGESVKSVAGAPEITSMAVHSERLFVTTGGEQTSLWFSDDFDPTNWFVSLDKAGFIDLQDARGRLLKVVSFNGYVYVFRNFGITRITAYGSQEEFSSSGLFLSSGRIYKNAIVECGNSIVYLAEDGFYLFDGYNSTRILREYDKFLFDIDNSEAFGKFFNGKLYVSLKMKLDKSISKVLLVYDFSNRSSYIAKGISVSDMEIISSNEFSTLVVLTDQRSEIGTLSKFAKLYNTSLTKVWKSNFSDFSIGGNKSLSKISLYTSTNIKIIIESEKSKATLSVFGKPQRQTLSVGLKGNSFSIKIISTKLNSNVSKVSLYFNCLGE